MPNEPGQATGTRVKPIHAMQSRCCHPSGVADLEMTTSLASRNGGKPRFKVTLEDREHAEPLHQALAMTTATAVAEQIDNHSDPSRPANLGVAIIGSRSANVRCVHAPFTNR